MPNGKKVQEERLAPTNEPAEIVIRAACKKVISKEVLGL